MYSMARKRVLVDTPNLADHTCLKTVISDSVLLPEPPCYTLVTCSKYCHHPTRNNEYSDLSRASHARVYTSYEMESHARQRLLYAVTVCLSMKMSMPLPATRNILVCDGTNRTVLKLTTQTRTQQLPEEYVKVVHSAVLTSIQLISTMLNQLSHTSLANSSSSMPSHTTVLEPQDLYMLTSSPTSHYTRYIQSSPSPSLSRSSLLGLPSYFIHILNGSPMDQLLTARSR